MAQDSEQLAEAVRSGEYFEQSRAWYRTVYIGPISERSFYLVVVIIAVLIALMAALALKLFLPVTSRPGILIGNERLFDTMPRLVPLRDKGSDMDRSLVKFFIANYVTKRESYAEGDYVSNYLFVRAQSDEATFAQYASVYNSANPNSPAAILGSNGQRVVTLQGFESDFNTPVATARVSFSTELQGIEGGSRANWTAEIKYRYTPLVVTPTIDSTTGRESYRTQDPSFQVVNYVLTQAR